MQAAAFDLTGSAPDFQTSTDPHAFDSLQGQLGDSSWWDSVQNDAGSVFHGPRHGAIRFKKLVSSWDSDANHWLVTLVVDIGNDIDNVISYVVHDAETAIHAISSFFQALGADLKQAWDWLKHNVRELIQEAEANAKVIEGLLSQAATQFGNLVGSIEISTNDFFTKLETQAHTQIKQFAQSFEQQTFGSSAPLPRRPATPAATTPT